MTWRKLAALRRLEDEMPEISRNFGPICSRCDLPAAREGVCETCQVEVMGAELAALGAELAEVTGHCAKVLCWIDKDLLICPLCNGTVSEGAQGAVAHRDTCPIGALRPFAARQRPAKAEGSHGA